jgi:hypothetical protein
MYTRSSGFSHYSALSVGSEIDRSESAQLCEASNEGA